jgi:hypothetical protein
MWCLTKTLTNEFKKALKEGKLDPTNLAKMSSEKRNSTLAKYVGEENVIQVNSLFESKLLLKNQKAGYISWAKKVSGITPEVKRDLISRIERLDKVLSPEEEGVFLKDLASTRLKVDVTYEEASNVYQLSKTRQDKLNLIKEDSSLRSKERIDYGLADVALKDYIGELKLQTGKPSILERLSPTKAFFELSGATKSFLSTLDNSFFGRQGIKMLYSNPKIWMRNFLKSWNDVGKELLGKDAMTPIKADVYSRPNAINGKYQTAKLDIGIAGEEAFPSTLPEKIPIIRRLFRAAETAFNGAALRMRADYADKIISVAEKQGIDTSSSKQMEGIGSLVNSMTGRGSIGKVAVMGKEINAALFSVRFLKSNVDTLTMHLVDPKATPFVKKEAALNMVKIIGSVAALETAAGMLWPGSVEPDPRSSNFGKIKIGNRTFDLTGGASSIITLAARILPTLHNGQLGFWSKSPTTGKMTQLNLNKYGANTALDVFENFCESKLAPVAGLVRDIWKGQTYSGDPVTFESSVKDLVTPLSIQTFEQLIKDPDKSNLLGTMILEGLGINVNVFLPSKTNWTESTSKELLQFREKVGDAKFKQANTDFNNQYNDWLKKIKQDNEFLSLSEEAQQSVLTKGKDSLKEKIFKDYHFKYKEVKTEKNKEEEKVIKGLIP